MTQTSPKLADTIAALDRNNMLRAIQEFPQQWQHGREIATSATLRQGPESVKSMLTCGMGGSGIGGALLAALAYGHSETSIQAARQYRPPAHAGKGTLAVVTSYSGNTAETLEAYEACLRSGCHVVAVTSGGELGALCAARGGDVITIPGGMMPRAALGYTFLPLLEVARRSGVVEVSESDLDEAYQVVAALAHEHARAAGGFGLEIANRLEGRLPVIYGGPGIMSAVTKRWSGQIQENAKTPSFNNIYPELNHNEVMGWERGALLDQVAFVELHDPDDHPDVKRRMAITRELLEPRSAGWISITPRGLSPLARMMYTVYLGDWVSFFLAMKHGVDPTPIKTIQQLKERL